MITFSKFGHHGNLGNQLHQLASLIGFSEKYNCELALPGWQYAAYFQHPPKQQSVQTELAIEESEYHYTSEFWDAYENDFKTKNVDITGWLQTEKYWQHCREKVYNSLQFETRFEEKIKLKFKKVLQEETIAVSIRRGDFITNPNFYLLPMEYYFGALQEYFPDHHKYNVLFFSDDLNYCAAHIKHFSNFYFATGLNGIEQLCLMRNCQHFIISNSSFSWWGAMLGEQNKNAKIIRSPYQLAGELLERFDTKDYYPERWLIYDHIDQPIPVNKFLNSTAGKEWEIIKQRTDKFIRKGKNYLKVKLK